MVVVRTANRHMRQLRGLHVLQVVTKRQATERATERAMRNQRTLFDVGVTAGKAAAARGLPSSGSAGPPPALAITTTFLSVSMRLPAAVVAVVLLSGIHPCAG